MQHHATAGPSTLTILPTYSCTAACENCCFGSHPGIQQRIPLARILDVIDQAAEMKTIRLIVFSGGECFTLGDELVIAVARATQHRIPTRCVSNGYWASSSERADLLLQRLRDAGLHELNISTGDYHAQFVSVDKVRNAARAAVRVGIRTVIVVESRSGRAFTAEKLFDADGLAGIAGNPLLKIIESPWMSMDERMPVQQDRTRLTSRATLHLKKGCDSVLNTIVVTPQLKLGACCGLTREQIPEMHAGSLLEYSLRDLYEVAANDFLKIWIAVEGPERILAWAASKDPSIEWEYKYAHHCEACRELYADQRVREVIRKHYHEREVDILLRYWLQNGDPPVPSAATVRNSHVAQ